MEKTVQFQHIRMVHVHLDPYLLNNLLFHLSFFYFGFVHNFYRIHKIGLPLLCDINVSEPSTSQLFSQSKLGNFDVLEVQWNW